MPLKISRRRALQIMTTVAAGSAGIARSAADGAPEKTGGRIPLIHLTDLYHPPQDPDDHFDLATIVGLPEYDLLGVVLDVTRKFLLSRPDGWDISRDPGYVPVAQLGYLTGRTIPTAMGPCDPLTRPDDPARDRPRPEQAGIDLLLDLLERSPQRVVISVVGSARVLAAAFNREPALVKAKTRVVLLNAGSTGGTKREWNVGLDPAAYVALWRSGLPIDWYPCATDSGAFAATHERGTFWKASHAVLLRDLSEGMRGWFAYAFTNSARGDIIRALAETGRAPGWEQVLAGERNLWATVSLVMGAGRVLARTPAGWRFVKAGEVDNREVWPLRLDPIEANVDDDARVSWHVARGPSEIRLFGRQPGAGYGSAMAEALGALLRAIPS